ncbi:MAG: TVP38/TMEM64 family protein, partial [Phycisphaerae bacterium]|nr:TVP38/TMEM64 family protein [Phycisphaerae bacterium]
MSKDMCRPNENDSQTEAKASPPAKGWWKPLVLLAAVIAIVVLSWALNMGEQLQRVKDWVAAQGRWAPVLYILVYIGATVAALPGIALTVPAGALFGPILGTVYVSIASTVGASLSFLLARYLARGAVVRWLSSKEKFRQLDRMSEDHGPIIVALTRLVPIFPFNLLNYGFGLTRVRFWTYVFWSWLCMLPFTVVLVVTGAGVTQAITEKRVPWILVLAVALSAVILTLLVRHA